MAASEALKGIEYFFETILRQASCSAHWNEESVSNAFMWADFCEQIYKKFADSPISKELDKYIHNLTLKSGSSCCFDNLRHSSSQLSQAFYQNPMVEKNFFDNIVLKVKPSELNLQEDKNDAEALGCLCSELVESLQPISISNSDRSLYYEVKAELFLKFLKDVTLQLVTEEQSETQLSLAFEMMCQSPEKMMVIIHVLMYDPQAESNDMQEIQNFAANFTLLKLLENPNGSLAQFLWNLPLPTLREIARKYASFYSFYLDFLTKAAQSLRLEYENYVKKWKRRISASEVALSYEDVVNHFRSLVATSADDISRATEGHLRSLMSAQTNSSIWQDIWSSLHTLQT